MYDPLEPANSNKTLSRVVDSSERRMAREALGTSVHLLKQSGVPRHMIADVLFELAQSTLVPKPEDMTGEAMRKWYAQVMRFIEELETHKELLERPADEIAD